MDKLMSLEEVEMVIDIGRDLTVEHYDALRQLAYAMRENDRLRLLLQRHHNVSSDGAYQNSQLRLDTMECLNPNKPTVPCTSCGKPMEDRGASKQWCKECSSKIAEGE